VEADACDSRMYDIRDSIRRVGKASEVLYVPRVAPDMNARNVVEYTSNILCLWRLDRTNYPVVSYC
jgi:hypothetical protein